MGRWEYDFDNLDLGTIICDMLESSDCPRAREVPCMSFPSDLHYFLFRDSGYQVPSIIKFGHVSDIETQRNMVVISLTRLVPALEQ
jgi:hypothetical protein